MTSRTQLWSSGPPRTPLVTGLLIVFIVGLTTLFGFALGMGLVDRHLIVMLVGFVGAAYLIGRKAQSRAEPWLPSLVSLGMVAKLIGSSVRYYILVVVYHGVGDAGRYHGSAVQIADGWRSFQVPDLATVAFGSEGTRFTAWITGLLYAPYQPSFLGGFWIFAFLAFLGQFFLYLAFRKAVKSERWKRYAILVFFWPTLIYWPSSIGKEALLFLFLGVGVWASANLLEDYKIRWVPLVASSAFLIFMIREHVAALFIGSLFLTVIFAKRRGSSEAMFRRGVLVVLGLAALIPIAIGVGERFGFDATTLSGDEINPVFADIADVTEQGGSAVAGGVIRSPVDVPAGLVKVLFRPLPFEADNAQMLTSSIEGTLLLGLVVWQLPKMIKNRRRLRRSPYLLFCLLYSCFFIWAWSAILNLGILARQRSLVIPFVLALVAALGWAVERQTPDASDEEKDLVTSPAPISQQVNS